MSKSTDETSKTEITNNQKELNNKIAELEKITAYNYGLVKTQESIIAKLSPKIDTLSIDINSAKITLIEVNSKVKTLK